ncbi:MAG: 4-hydroxy-tetrahydrodipicolinate reductase [Pseudomonadota bacterium]
MRVGVTGCKGRVGQLLVEDIEANENLTYAGGIDKDDDTASLFKEADCIIDFTIPDATIQHAKLAAEHGTSLVIGTTGLDSDQEQILKDCSKDTVIVYAANMSIGVNILLGLVQQTAQKLKDDWDIEIFETHHHHKIDSPSGTALALGKAAQAGRGGGEFVTDRAGKRNQGDIGYAVQRGGDVVGEHDVTFFSDGERIKLSHIATDRRLFVKGALRAAQWTKDKANGLYSMNDVLDIKL